MGTRGPFFESPDKLPGAESEIVKWIVERQ